MEFMEKVAEKLIPWGMIVVIASLFGMYMDVSFLKITASDYLDRANESHKKYEIAIEACTKNDIVQNKDIEYLLKGK